MWQSMEGRLGVWYYLVVFWSSPSHLVYYHIHRGQEVKKKASRLRIMMLQSGMRDGENENDGFHGYYDDCSQTLVIL